MTKMKKPKKDEINGTHLQGNFNKPYLELIKILGKPDYDYRKSDELTDNKISVEWEFKFSDGTDDIIATIYNWKDGINYDDIVKLAIKMGSIDPNPNDKLKNRVEQGYFDFMANIILGFEPKWKEVK